MTAAAEMVPDFDIRCDGVRMPPDARDDVDSVTVLEDLDALSMFTVVLYNRDPERLAVSWSDDPLFAIGTEVKIALGFVGGLHPVMTGEVTSLEPTFAGDGLATLTVRGYDHRHRLARSRKTRTFTRTKDSEIARQLAKKARLRTTSATVPETPTPLDYVIQHNQTDLEFLRTRARLIGYEVYVRDKVLYFRPPQHGRKPTENTTLTVGEEISEFTPRLRTSEQVHELSVRGWDVAKRKAVVGTARAGQESTKMGGTATGPQRASQAFGRATVTSVDVPVPDQARADEIARGRFDALALTYISGEATCGWQPGLRAGQVIDIQGAGKTFSGAYYPTSVSHMWSRDQGCRTELDVRRNAE